MSESPQVKRYLTSNITNFVHEFPQELLNDLTLFGMGGGETGGLCYDFSLL